MWPFKVKETEYKAKIQGWKRIVINGMSFVIRKINPLIDLPSDKIPQIFTEFQSRRPVDPNKIPTQQEIIRIQNDMKIIICAGVVSPHLVKTEEGDKHGKEDGLTVEDLFRDPSMGYKLYLEIFSHSLNVFRGLKGVFFSIRLRLLLLMRWRRDMESARRIWFSIPEIHQ